MNTTHESATRDATARIDSERDALPCLCCGTAMQRCEATTPTPTRHRSARWLIATLAAMLLALGFTLTRARAAEALPGDSVYQLGLPLVDQDGQAFDFAAGRGKPRLISMFYSSCKFVCPMIVDTLRNTERALDPAQRKQIDVLLVSLDPDTDTPAALKHLADQRHIDTPRWRLARTDAAHVRRLAAVLGVQYKQLGKADFSHSTVLVLLDANGRIAARSEKLGDADPAFVDAIRRVLAPD